MKTLTLKLDDALCAQVGALAKRRGTTKSAVVRDAIKACLDQRHRSPLGSARALAKDLAGCVTGPADLSTNRAHLRGFGR